LSLHEQCSEYVTRSISEYGVVEWYWIPCLFFASTILRGHDTNHQWLLFETSMNSTTSTSSAGGSAKQQAMVFVTGAVVERREKVLAIMPRISGSLSMLGSALVAFHIVKKVWTKDGLLSYHYIILAMALVDFFSSFAYALGVTPMPPGPSPKFQRPHRYGARGNEHTCAAQGFGIQFGITIILLNLLLSVHYLCVIRWRVREEQLRKWVGPGLAIVFAIGLSLAVPLIFLKGYNYTPVWCWIGPNFSHCADDGLSVQECRDRAYLWRNFMYFLPLWLLVGLTTIIQLAIFWTVRSTESRTEKWKFSSVREKKASKRREQRGKRRLNSSRAVAIQSMLYLSSFFISWIPYTIASYVLQDETGVLESNLFWLLLFVVALQPVQGFLNCMIFFHRRFGSWMKPVLESAATMCHCRFTKLPPLEETPVTQTTKLSSGDVERADDRHNSKKLRESIVSNNSIDSCHTTDDGELPTDLYQS
jgi:hypothetical protein